MKRLYIILILLLVVLFSTGCVKEIAGGTISSTSIFLSTTTLETSTLSDNNDLQIAYDKLVIDNTNLVEDNEKLVEENDSYKALLNNLNNLLSNVYYGYASNDKYILDGFTAFSIYYKDKYYIITAGHAVEQEGYGKFSNFKFKANFSDEWIYPKLLAYENNPDSREDYAIFYSDKIKSGFIVDEDRDSPVYILGNNDIDINVIKDSNMETHEGESGSPIIDIEQEVVGIAVTNQIKYYTHIKVISNKIDELK